MQHKKESAAEAVSFQVVVTDLDGNETTFEYTSNAATVGDALVAEGLVVGHQASYGLYVDSVNGEYATTGIGDTPITADTIYNLTLSKG